MCIFVLGGRNMNSNDAYYILGRVKKYSNDVNLKLKLYFINKN